MSIITWIARKLKEMNDNVLRQQSLAAVETEYERAATCRPFPGWMPVIGGKLIGQRPAVGEVYAARKKMERCRKFIEHGAPAIAVFESSIT